MEYLKIIGLWLVVAVMSGLAACEKAVMDDDDMEQPEKQGNVVIRTSIYNIVPFNDTRAVQSMADYCTTISFVFYQDGSKVKSFTQKKGDTGFGQLITTLGVGTYQLLILAHSCPFGNPTMSDPAAIKFTNTDSGYSDTFYYYDDLTVTEAQNTYDLMLQRATSMASITINDDSMPEEVAKIRVYWEGESGVFNATTGWGGTTNSKQYVMYDVAGQPTPLTLNAYTFLRNETGTLTITLTAYDSHDAAIAEKVLKDVPMKNRMVTEYTGKLFTSTNTDLVFNLQAETDWEVYEQVAF